MKNKPKIHTAIPSRRYQVGEFSVTLLAEIESGDERPYRYILAFVPAGQGEPSLYLCSAPVPRSAADQGRYELRILSEVMDEVVDVDDRWGDLSAFAEEGIRLGMQALSLGREQVTRLL